MQLRFSYNEADLARLPARPARSHKGTFGQVLVVGGCPGMSGAAYFSAKAAYRTGCGLVRILAPRENRVIYQSQLPEAVLTLYEAEQPAEETVKQAVAAADAIVLGVGLGVSETAVKLVRWTLEAAGARIVLDADGINCLAANPGLWKLVPTETVLTPHPREMMRLTGLPLPEILGDIPAAAESFARETGTVLVLKDAHTAVSDGSCTMINQSGNSGMATGGSGDVLAGIIAGLLAQGMGAFEAAALGVYIHGLAGDRAAEKLSEYSVMASDLLEYLPQVLKEIKK